MNWTPEMDDAIATRFEAGLSARAIGEKLGITRNAVLGRKFRLGLCGPKRKAKLKASGLLALGRAARACGFTVADLEQVRRELAEDGL